MFELGDTVKYKPLEVEQKNIFDKFVGFIYEDGRQIDLEKDYPWKNPYYPVCPADIRDKAYSGINYRVTVQTFSASILKPCRIVLLEVCIKKT
jgi:hypothetical protein